MAIIVLVTHWSDDYWYKSDKAPYQRNFEPKILEFRKQKYKAIGLYWKGTLKGSYIDRTHLNPAFLFLNDVECKNGGIIVSYEYFGRNCNFNSQMLAERIMKLDRYKDGFPLCFVIENQEWEEICRDLSIIPPKQWESVVEFPSQWLGEYFLKMEDYDWRAYEKAVADCFSILGFRVNRLGESKENEMARVPDGYLYTPPTTSQNASFWITYDCKAKHNFPELHDKPADEERKMIEYIQTEERRVHLQGVESNNKYFLYIAHSFTPHAIEMCRRIQNNTRAMGGLMTTKTLIYLVEKRLKTGYKFVIENIISLFENKEISSIEIDRIYPIKDEF